MGIFILVAIGAFILFGLLPWLINQIKIIYGRLVNQGVTNIFDGNYLESKAFYLSRFKRVPCITSAGSIDIAKAFEYVQNCFSGKIIDIYQSCRLNREARQQEFNKTIFILDNRVMVELAWQHAVILYPNNLYGFANNLIMALSEFKMPEKEKDFEMNIITLSSTGLELKPLKITPIQLDLNLYYNDDFKSVDELVRNRLGRQNDKGIVLLHGLPGTGKTTYLRHLIGTLTKKVLFVSPSVANNLMNPEFIDLLVENPNAILVIEDAENIIIDRKYNKDSSVSNLLNLSDGLLSDCLNVQIICTFNSSLNLIDSALLRKGRLIAMYEFGKLGVQKARALSKYLGYDREINEAMTIAEIANPQGKAEEPQQMEVIGFRRQTADMN